MKASFATLATLMSVVLLGSAALAQAPKDAAGSASPFARGEKLPGDLSDLLKADPEGRVTDEAAMDAVKRIQQEANAGARTERGDVLLRSLDRNSDGRIDEEEARVGAAMLRRETPEGKQVSEMLGKLDTDGDARVSRQEFSKLAEQLGPLGAALAPQLNRVFVTLDTDRDNSINPIEAMLGADKIARGELAGGFGDRRFADRPPSSEGDSPDRRRRGFRGFGERDRAAEAEAAAERQFVEQVTRQFAALDRNNDGRLTEQEAARNRDVMAVFKQIDTDLDGALTLDEVLAFSREQRAAQKAASGTGR